MAPASTTELQVLLLSASKRQLASRTQRLAGTAVVYLTDRGHGCALRNPRHLCSSTSTLSQTSLCTTSGPAVRRVRSTRGTCQGGIQSLSRWPDQAGIVMRSCKDGLRQQCAPAVEYMCATQTAALAATWPGQCLLPSGGRCCRTLRNLIDEGVYCFHRGASAYQRLTVESGATVMGQSDRECAAVPIRPS